MVYLITASKDASVYNLYPNKNTGLDEILQISKAYTNLYERNDARTYLQFKTDNLPSYVTASSVYLNLLVTEQEELPINYSLYGYAVSESWDMGIGTWPESINSDGITWNNQPNIIDTISSSQFFEYESGDVSMDIKNIFNFWTASVNYGIRISHTSSIESSSLNYGILKFYSKETNTFLQPYIKIEWDDQVYQTGSLTSLPNGESILKTKELKSNYPMGEIVKINLTARKKYPVKTFTNTFSYLTDNYLPINSFYSVVDVITKRKIIDFTNYNKISCNNNENFIKLNTTNFPINRPLKLVFKIIKDGVVEYYEDDLTFIIK